MTQATQYPKNFDKYPKNVKEIIEKDILKRSEDSVVRRAYFLATELHDGQKRKGIDEPDHITHSLQVYDLVHKCIGDDETLPDRDVLLAASLLHDGIEDYKEDEIKKYLKLLEKGVDPKTVKPEEVGINPLVARQQAIEKIRKAYPNEEFADKLLKLVGEVTNPVDFGTVDGKIISKTKWQADKMKGASVHANLIKICDKTMSAVSNIEEVPHWNYDRIRNNISKSVVVVYAASDNVKKDDKYYPAVEHATKIFNLVAKGSQNILREMREGGIEIPPKHQFASFTLKVIREMIRTGNTENKSLDQLGR